MKLHRATIIASGISLALLLSSVGLAVDFSGTIPRGDAISNLPTNFQSVPKIIAEIFNFVIAISGAIFLIMLLVGGVQYLTGAGNEETTTKARRLMVDAIIGFILVIAAYAIGVFIINRLYGQAVVPGSSLGGSSATGGGGLPLNTNPEPLQ